MSVEIDLSETVLNEQQKKAMQLLCESVASLPDTILKAIILYGSAVRNDYRSGLSDINLLIILDSADMNALKSLIEPVTIGRSERIAPLFLTIPDLLKAVEAFPLKFLSIRESHRLLYGDNPLVTIEVDKEPLRWRCQQEMLNLLMRLRRHYLNSMGYNLAGFLATSIKGFMEGLRVFLYLANGSMPRREETLDVAASALGADADINVLHQMIKIKDSKEVPENDIVQTIYDRYLRLVQRIVYMM